ncbi:hypothetical protein [Oceanicola sp. S124]|nr:hypothetical protein [Oceanicola sp. S124]
MFKRLRTRIIALATAPFMGARALGQIKRYDPARHYMRGPGPASERNTD